MSDVIDKAVDRPRAPAPRRPRRAVPLGLRAPARRRHGPDRQAGTPPLPPPQRRPGDGSRARCGRRWRPAGAATEVIGVGGLGDDVRDGRVPEVRAALDRMWPVLTPAELLHDLFGSMGLLRLAADGVLDDFEYKALHRPRSESVDDVRWTPADVALLDDAREVLGPKLGQGRQARRGRRDPHLRSHRDRRGPGPHADAAQDGDAAFAQRLDDGGRRHRPGHRGAGARRLGRGARPPARPQAGPRDRPVGRLPHPGPDHGARQPR